jgi:hypothetical protein
MTKWTVQCRFMSKRRHGEQKKRRPFPDGVFFDSPDRN